MSNTVFGEPIRMLYGYLTEMSANLAYIQQELPSLEMDDEMRTAISGMCDEFNSVVYDVRKEVRTLEDK